MTQPVSFVVPWYGANIPGGAENLCKTTAEHLAKSGLDVDVLTTCSKQFLSDWKNYLPVGEEKIEGVSVKRFRVNDRNTLLFDMINGKLMKNQKIPPAEETKFINNIINSDTLCQFITEHDERTYIFTPYMFGTTYFGSKIRPQHSYLIPCLHDESYAHMSIYKSMFEGVRGLMFNSKSEMNLAKRIFTLKNELVLMGVGIDTDIVSDAKRFREKYGIDDDFILYVGRKDQTKNTPLLVEYFRQYKKYNPAPLRLVLVGGGKIEIPTDIKPYINDLGYIPEQDKRDAYSAASVLCQPSVNESFSIVIMESWVCGTPVIVNGKCEVTREHCVESNGGLYFNDYPEFEECVRHILANPEEAKKMGAAGRRHVINNFSWPKIVEKYMEVLP